MSRRLHAYALVRRSPDSLPLTRSLYADDTALSLNPGLANSMDTNTSTVSLDPDAALSVDTCTGGAPFAFESSTANSMDADACTAASAHFEQRRGGLPRPRTS
jgi:hypothetical protein